MKTTFAICFRMVLFSATCLAAANGADEPTEIEKLEKQFREDFFKDFTVKATPLTNKALSECFTAEFYRAELKVPHGRAITITDAVYAKTLDQLIDVGLPPTTAPLPALLRLVNPSFTIKTEQDADLLIGVLKELYPNDKDEVKPRVIRKEKTWLLITGKFFQHYSGFEIRTDDTGKITAIIRNLDLIEISQANKPGEAR